MRADPSLYCTIWHSTYCTWSITRLPAGLQSRTFATFLVALFLSLFRIRCHRRCFHRIEFILIPTPIVCTRHSFIRVRCSELFVLVFVFSILLVHCMIPRRQPIPSLRHEAAIKLTFSCTNSINFSQLRYEYQQPLLLFGLDYFHQCRSSSERCFKPFCCACVFTV